MAFNGSGTFERIYNWVNDKANGYKITASRMDGEFDGIATGLSQCITKDGQTTISANIPMSNYKFTGLGNGSSRTDSIALGQVQDGTYTYLGTTSGSADAYTLTPSPSITAYATTQQFTVKIHATNTTTTPYLQISAIANPTTTAVIKKLSATKTEIAVEASDLLINGIYHFQRNSANDAWILLNPLTKATSTVQGISYLLPNRNVVINGNFSINQRVVSGTVSLSAGSYGHDRWKAGSSGCTYTFSTTNNITTLTITAGSLIQVVEGNNLISDTYCLSWSGTAQGKIGAGSYGATGITGSATGGTDLNIEFNTGTLSLVQFEKNLAPTPFEHRFYNNELALCQRYYYKTFPQATVPAQNAGLDGAFLFGNPATSSPGVFTPNLRFPVLMRTNPTITLYNPSAANAQIRNINNSSDFSGTASQNVSVYGLNFTGTSTGSQAQSCAIHITATAEI